MTRLCYRDSYGRWHEDRHIGGRSVRALTLKRQTVLATRVHASDSCHLLVRAGSVKVVFACTCTTHLDGSGCPAGTDGLDGFCPALDNSAAGAGTPAAEPLELS